MKRTYMNGREMCICCRGPPEKDAELIVHHVKYFPEVCCYVHWKCHNEIHEEPSRHPHLVQYGKGDGGRFYDARGEGKGGGGGGLSSLGSRARPLRRR